MINAQQARDKVDQCLRGSETLLSFSSAKRVDVPGEPSSPSLPGSSPSMWLAMTDARLIDVPANGIVLSSRLANMKRFELHKRFLKQLLIWDDTGEEMTVHAAEVPKEFAAAVSQIIARPSLIKPLPDEDTSYEIRPYQVVPHLAQFFNGDVQEFVCASCGNHCGLRAKNTDKPFSTCQGCLRRIAPHL